VYICYLDESGTPDRSSNTDHFVLFGLAIPALSWKAKDRQVQEIRSRYGLADAEIHTAFMLREYPAQRYILDFEALDTEERRRQVRALHAMNLSRKTGKSRRLAEKNYVATDAYVHLTLDERLSVVRELADLFGSWDDSCAFAEAQNKNRVREPPEALFDIAFEQVVTRFNTFIERCGAENDVGLVVQDNNESAARRLTDLMLRFHATGTKFKEVPRIVETPLFVDSHLTSLVQIADLGGYATRRFFERGEDDLFQRIYPRFDRTADKVVGIRHYTGKYQCACRVCVDHGRYVSEP
jgi:Protein of unknown function (DUF3800)